MRINDSSNFSNIAGSLSKQIQPQQKNQSTSGVSSAPPSPQPSATTQSTGSTSSRTDRIAQLKQTMAQGQPIDVSKLADSMMGSGLFVDENA